MGNRLTGRRSSNKLTTNQENSSRKASSDALNSGPSETENNVTLIQNNAIEPESQIPPAVEVPKVTSQEEPAQPEATSQPEVTPVVPEPIVTPPTEPATPEITSVPVNTPEVPTEAPLVSEIDNLYQKVATSVQDAIPEQVATNVPQVVAEPEVPKDVPEVVAPEAVPEVVAPEVVPESVPQVDDVPQDVNVQVSPATEDENTQTKITASDSVPQEISDRIMEEVAAAGIKMASEIISTEIKDKLHDTMQRVNSLDLSSSPKSSSVLEQVSKPETVSEPQLEESKPEAVSEPEVEVPKPEDQEVPQQAQPIADDVQVVPQVEKEEEKEEKKEGEEKVIVCSSNGNEAASSKVEQNDLMAKNEEPEIEESKKAEIEQEETLTLNGDLKNNNSNNQEMPPKVTTDDKLSDLVNDLNLDNNLESTNNLNNGNNELVTES